MAASATRIGGSELRDDVQTRTPVSRTTSDRGSISPSGDYPVGVVQLPDDVLLGSLKFKGHPLGDDGAASIAKRAVAYFIDFRRCGIGNKGAVALAENRIIRCLDLTENKIGIEGVHALLQSRTLQKLYFGKKSLSVFNGEDIKKIAWDVAQNETLHTLALSHYGLGDQGVVALAEALKNNNTLRVLDLTHNNIDDRGALALAEALAENDTLEELYLTDNWIGQMGYQAILDVLTNRNKHLRVLNLDENRHLDRCTMYRNLLNPCELNLLLAGRRHVLSSQRIRV